MAVENETLWRVIEYSGAVVCAVCSTMAGWVWKEYRKDKQVLAELKDRSKELDAIPKLMTLGTNAKHRLDIAEVHISNMQDGLHELTETTKDLQEITSSIDRKLAAISTDVRWLCENNRD